jgi:hypothetical protein
LRRPLPEEDALSFDFRSNEEVTFSLRQLRERVQAELPAIDQIPPAGGFHFRYDGNEWRIPGSELQNFIDYLMNIGLIDEDAVERLVDRRARREHPLDVASDRRRNWNRRRRDNGTAPRRRMADYLDV